MRPAQAVPASSARLGWAGLPPWKVGWSRTIYPPKCSSQSCASGAKHEGQPAPRWWRIPPPADMCCSSRATSARRVGPLRDTMGPRFINCGVAERNMKSVAALASEGWKSGSIPSPPFATLDASSRSERYLLAPAARPPVRTAAERLRLWGATHHAVEDCGTPTLPYMQVLVPAFDEDVAAVVAPGRPPPIVLHPAGRGEGPRATARPPSLGGAYRGRRPGGGARSAGRRLQALSGAGLGAELWAVGACRCRLRDQRRCGSP
jgi:hypothetical protein